MMRGEKTYRNGPYEVHVGPGGEIKVRPGDTLWGYSMAIYGNAYSVNKFARFQGKLLMPIRQTDKIYAGETIYHIETYLSPSPFPAMVVEASPRAPIQVPATPGPQERVRITVDWIIEQCPDLAAKRDALQKLVDSIGAEKGLEISDLVKILKTAGKFVRLFKDLTPLGAVLNLVSAPAQMLSLLGEIGRDTFLDIIFLGHKAYAYGLTAWAFRDPPPDVPAADLQKLGSWVSGERRVEKAKQVWAMRTREAGQAMDKACLDDGIPIKYGQMLIRSKYDLDRRKLAAAVYAAFESGLKPSERDMHRKLSCDYPN